MFKNCKYLALILLTIMALSGFSLAADIEPIKVYIDQMRLDTSEIAPELIDGRTFLPFRLIVEALGMEVSYDAATLTITVGDGIMTHRVGQTFVTLASGETMDAGVPSYIKDGRTMVSLRLFAEALKLEVQWVPESNRVNIISNELPNLGTQDYNNSRFGYSLTIPYYFQIQPEPDNNDGCVMIIDDEKETSLSVWGSYLIEDQDDFIRSLTYVMTLPAEFEKNLYQDERYDEAYHWVVLCDDLPGISWHIVLDIENDPSWYEYNKATMQQILDSLSLFMTGSPSTEESPEPILFQYFDDVELENYNILNEETKLSEEAIVNFAFIATHPIMDFTIVEILEDDSAFKLYYQETMSKDDLLQFKINIPEGAARYYVSYNLVGVNMWLTPYQFWLSISGLDGMPVAGYFDLADYDPTSIFPLVFDYYEHFDLDELNQVNMELSLSADATTTYGLQSLFPIGNFKLIEEEYNDGSSLIVHFAKDALETGDLVQFTALLPEVMPRYRIQYEDIYGEIFSYWLVIDGLSNTPMFTPVSALG